MIFRGDMLSWFSMFLTLLNWLLCQFMKGPGKRTSETPNQYAERKN